MSARRADKTHRICVKREHVGACQGCREEAGRDVHAVAGIDFARRVRQVTRRLETVISS